MEGRLNLVAVMADMTPVNAVAATVRAGQGVTFFLFGRQFRASLIDDGAHLGVAVFLPHARHALRSTDLSDRSFAAMLIQLEEWALDHG